MSRRSTLHGCHAPSLTHAELIATTPPVADGLFDVADLPGSESLRVGDVLAEEAMGARALSVPGDRSREHAMTASTTVARREARAYQPGATPFTRMRIRTPRWRRARSEESARRTMSRRCARSDNRLP